MSYFIFKGNIKTLKLILNRNNENQKTKEYNTVNLEFYIYKKYSKIKPK